MPDNTCKMFLGILGILFFTLHRILVTILEYNWDPLDVKFASLSVHRDIRRNSENIEP